MEFPLRFHSSNREAFGQDLSHSATPPWREQAPRCVAACEYVPSLHFAVALVGSVFAAVGRAAVAFADLPVSFTSDETALLVAFSAALLSFAAALLAFTSDF